MIDTGASQCPACHQVYVVRVSVGATNYDYTVTAFDALSMGVPICSEVSLNGFLGCPAMLKQPERYNGKVYYSASCELQR